MGDELALKLGYTQAYIDKYHAEIIKQIKESKYRYIIGKLNNIDFSFSVVLDENGNIETMILSHVSGSDLYLFHTNPGKLDANAEPYEGVANSYDVEKFIKKMMED